MCVSVKNRVCYTRPWRLKKNHANCFVWDKDAILLVVNYDILLINFSFPIIRNGAHCWKLPMMTKSGWNHVVCTRHSLSRDYNRICLTFQDRWFVIFWISLFFPFLIHDSCAVCFATTRQCGEVSTCCGVELTVATIWTVCHLKVIQVWKTNYWNYVELLKSSVSYAIERSTHIMFVCVYERWRTARAVSLTSFPPRWMQYPPWASEVDWSTRVFCLLIQMCISIFVFAVRNVLQTWALMILSQLDTAIIRLDRL